MGGLGLGGPCVGGLGLGGPSVGGLGLGGPCEGGLGLRGPCEGGLSGQMRLKWYHFVLSLSFMCQLPAFTENSLINTA